MDRRVSGIDIAMPVNLTISDQVTMRVPDGMTFALPAPSHEIVAAYDASRNYVGNGYASATAATCSDTHKLSTDAPVPASNADARVHRTRQPG